MGTSIQPTSRKVIAKDMRQGSLMFAICMQSLAIPQEQNVNPELKQVLEDFADLFQEPTQLPPTREVDHHINLQEGTMPINV